MGAAHQIAALTIGPDGHLYVQMGDGFDVPRAQQLDSFRGKILRVAIDGSAPTDNPFYDATDGISARDYVFAYGLRNPFGAVWRDADGRLYTVENGAGVDRLARVSAGLNYGWDGTDASLRTEALYVWEPSTAPVNIAFVEPTRFHGSGFPTARFGRAYVSLSGPTYALGPQDRGKRIEEITIAADGSSTSDPVTFVEYNGTGASTVVGLTAGPDGLYFTDLYPSDPATLPTAAGANVYRVRHASE